VHTTGAASVAPAPRSATAPGTVSGAPAGSGPVGSAANVAPIQGSSAAGVSASSQAASASPVVPGGNTAGPPSLIGSGATGVTGSLLPPSLGNAGLGGIQTGVASPTASGFVASGSLPALMPSLGTTGDAADLNPTAKTAGPGAERADTSSTGSTGLPSPTNPSGSGPVSTLPSLVNGSLTPPIRPAATEGSGGLGSGAPTTRPTITPKEEAAEERSRAAVTAICNGC
jgi:hypothetical protein